MMCPTDEMKHDQAKHHDMGDGSLTHKLLVVVVLVSTAAHNSECKYTTDEDTCANRACNDDSIGNKGAHLEETRYGK